MNHMQWYKPKQTPIIGTLATLHAQIHGQEPTSISHLGSPPKLRLPILALICSPSKPTTMINPMALLRQHINSSWHMQQERNLPGRKIIPAHLVEVFGTHRASHKCYLMVI